MYSSKRCIVDNWSLEQAGSLLNGDFEQYTFTDELFIESLGGLSNYINAILLYDEAKFIANGFQTNWYRFSWFLKNTRLYFEPFLPTGNLVDWNSHISLPDLGAITKTFSLGIPNRKSYFTFLKDVIACRAEAFSLKNQVERVFKERLLKRKSCRCICNT